MDRRCRPRSRHGSRRRRDQRAGEHLRAARLPADTGPAVPDHGSVRDGGPGTLAGGCRYGLGLHARAAAGPGRCRRQSDRDLGRARDRAIRRSGRGARRAAGAGLSRPIAGRHIFGPRVATCSAAVAAASVAISATAWALRRGSSAQAIATIATVARAKGRPSNEIVINAASASPAATPPRSVGRVATATVAASASTICHP